ncbi:MAG: glycosyltransferase [Pseudanabaena sp.]
MPKPNICIVSFSDLTIDARVNRQIKAVVSRGNITVLAFGKPNVNEVEFIALDSRKTILTKIKLLLHLLNHSYEQYYWSQDIVKESLAKLNSRYFDIFIANDLGTLPLAINLSKRYNAKVFFDAHEYAPLEFDNRWSWKYLHQPFREYLCGQYLQDVDVMTTVCDGIAKKYKKEYQVQPEVVLNAPHYQTISHRPVCNPNKIKLIHHGSASSERQIEKMIQIIPYLDNRFEMHFMLVGNPQYIQKLKKLARNIAPNRVFFHDAVPIEVICSKLSEYDVGVYLLQPLGFNYTYAMPNKLFDFIMSGLCVAIAPSIEMQKIVQHYNCGVVAKDFHPASLAATINALSVEDINKKKLASLEAAKTLNAEIEGQKIQEIIGRLF